jgi:tetratricopeptide (TPR) repeat protein
MQSTQSSARNTLPCRPGLVDFLILTLTLLLLSGCGLAMDSADRLDRAENALAAGDVRAAIIDAKDVLLNEPDNLRGRLLLARASIEIGDGATAEKELRRAIQLGTTPTEIAAELGRALLLQGKFDEVLSEVPLDGIGSAEVEASVRQIHGDAYLGLNQAASAREMFSSALQLQPDNLDARLGIASSYIAEGNFAQARGNIDNVLETNADDPRVWLYSGSYNVRLGDFETAAANFQVALDRADKISDSSSRLQALAGLGESLLAQQDIEQARIHIDLLKIEASQSFQTMLLVARLAYIDQQWTTAQENLQQILRVAPNYRPAQMLLGAVHLRSGNLSQAEMYLSSAVASVPGDVRARQMLAETRLQMRKADEALEALAPILSGPDADSLTLQLAARASLGERDIDEGIEYLRRSVDEDPGNEDLRFQLAVTLLEVGRTDEAQAVLDEIDVSGSEEDAYRRDVLGVLKSMRDGQAPAALQAAKQVAGTFSTRSSAFNLLGAIHLANQDLDAAIVSFERALELDPTELLAQRYLAAISESQGEFASAVSQYEKILEDDADATWAIFALGRIAFRQEEYEQAKEQFGRASELEPDNAVYRLNLARTEVQLGNDSEAIRILDSEFEATIKHLQSAVMLSMLKAKTGDLAGAMDIAEQQLRLYPENPVPHALQGEIYLLDGKPTYADSAYAKALSLGPLRSHVLRAYRIKRDLGVVDAQQPLIDYLEIRPLDNDMRVFLAESYMQNDDLSKSISSYQEVVSGQPDNAVALNNLAWAYYLVDDPRAIETAQKAHELMPDNGAIVDTLGWIMIQKGSAEEGEKMLRKAVEMENGRAEIRYHHAVALARLGRIEEARGTLQEIIESGDVFASREDAEKMMAEL